jgi:DNA-directed RNA polymerase subunit RPC12/RpoP
MSIVKDRLKKEVKDMIKYKCTRCGKIWYTETYLPPNQKCICGGKIKSEKEVK